MKIGTTPPRFSVSRAAACGERLFNVLDNEEYLVENDEVNNVPVLGVLEFNNVSFSFPGKDQPKILEDINLRLEPGFTLGIIGSQGSGKSTLTQLIPRFYDPTSGDIRFNGVDLRDYKLNSLREAVSLVQQDTFLFTSSV